MKTGFRIQISSNNHRNNPSLFPFEPKKGEKEKRKNMSTIEELELLVEPDDLRMACVFILFVISSIIYGFNFVFIIQSILGRFKSNRYKNRLCDIHKEYYMSPQIVKKQQ